jgi:hypothetical protein
MKKYLIIILFVFSCLHIWGQGVEFNGVFTGSGNKDFNNIFGCEFAFNTSASKKINLGLSVSYYNFKKEYTNKGGSDSKSNTTIFNTDNSYKIISFKPFLEESLIKTSKTEYFLGIDLPINYINSNCKSQGIEIKGYSDTMYTYYNKSFSQLNDNSEYWKFGIGIYFKTELNKFIYPNLSLNFKINPEFIFGGLPGMKDDTPYNPRYDLYSMIHFQVGISYKLKSNKK